MDPITSCIDHLQAVLQGQPIDESIVQKAVSKLTLDTSLTVNDDRIVSALFPLAIGVLKDVSITSEQAETVISLVQALLSNKSFSKVLEFAPVDLLLEALNSPSDALQRAAIAQLRLADPPDMVASTPLVEALVDLVQDPSAPPSAVDALAVLGSQGPLVRRRLFSGSCLEKLTALFQGNDATLQSRVMDLVQRVLPADEERLIPYDKLVLLDPEKHLVQSSDPLAQMAVLLFYRTLLENAHPSDLPAAITPQLEGAFQLFASDDPLTKSLLLSEIYHLFGALSRADPELMQQLDKKYNLTASPALTNWNDESAILLTTVLSPVYLADQAPNAISALPINHSTIRAIASLSTNSRTYSLLHVTAEKLTNLAFPDLMFVLEAFTCTEWATRDIIQWPSVMDALLNVTQLSDKDAITFRQEALTNLVGRAEQVPLGMWDAAIRRELYKARYGHSIAPRAEIADESSQ